jgi:polyisoprenoid-binding protein YceI
LVGVLNHDVRFSAAPEPWRAESPAGDALDIAIEGKVQVSKFEPPPSTSASDRARMLESLRGRGGLDADRWPTLTFRGNYRGSLSAGTLSGQLSVRGVPRSLSFPMRWTNAGSNRLRGTAEWQGTLNQLGIEPPKVLFGAIKLVDWIRIVLDIELEQS